MYIQDALYPVTLSRKSHYVDLCEWCMLLANIIRSKLTKFFLVVIEVRFNLKMSSYQCRKFHCGDKTVSIWWGFLYWYDDIFVQNQDPVFCIECMLSYTVKSLIKVAPLWAINCWSLRCSWSIACRRCSNYIFILNLTHGFNRLGEDNCKTRGETFKFWDWCVLYYRFDGTCQFSRHTYYPYMRHSNMSPLVHVVMISMYLYLVFNGTGLSEYLVFEMVQVPLILYHVFVLSCGTVHNLL